MSEHAEQIAKVASTVAYSLCSGLVISDWLQFLNANAAAVGIFIAILTYLTSLFFQIINSKAIRVRCDDE